jgi:hypothetical protein
MAPPDVLVGVEEGALESCSRFSKTVGVADTFDEVRVREYALEQSLSLLSEILCLMVRTSLLSCRQFF